jgi:cysteine desulfurase / selenocysteine lyase
MIDVAAARRATPGCEGIAHLNNAGASLVTQATLDTVNGFLQLEAALGGYEAETAATGSLEAVRNSAARLIHATPAEIALTTSDTHGFSKAFWGLVLGGWFKAGDLVVVDRLSYNSHHFALVQAAPFVGIRVSVADDLTAIPPDARLVAYTLIGTHTGRVHDLAGVSEQTAAMGIPFFVDAAQTVGQRVVDVQALGCDVLTTNGRKWLRGPRGSGFLYVRQPWIERMQPPGVDGRGGRWTSVDTFSLLPDARRFEEFETSVAARLGLGAAIDQALELGLENIAERVGYLGDMLRSELDALGNVHLMDGEGDRSGIVTFRVQGHEPGRVVDRAAAAGINVNSPNGPWTGVNTGGFLTSVVRASPHYYNTEEEVDQLVTVVAGLR